MSADVLLIGILGIRGLIQTEGTMHLIQYIHS